jgi:hypothetical protein
MRELRGSRLAARMTMLVTAAALLVMSLAAAPSANANSPYCNNQLLGYGGACAGAARHFYQAYGWGDQHSVCVWYRTEGWGSNGNACSSGPGAGVYSARLPEINYAWEPGINNNAPGENVVHGVALE